MNKISAAQAGQMMKLAAENLRGFSEENANLRAENVELREKVAHHEREQRIVKIAQIMEDKGLNPHLSMEEKIDNLRQNERLEVVEEAVSMQASQVKTAHVADGNRVSVEGGDSGNAESNFVNDLVSE